MLKRFIKYYRPHIKLFVIDMVCAFAISLIDLIFPYMTNLVLKKLIPNQAMRMVFIIGAVLLIFYIVRFIFSYIVGFWGHTMGIRIETDMRTDLYNKFQTLDYQFYDDKRLVS